MHSAQFETVRIMGRTCKHSFSVDLKILSVVHDLMATGKEGPTFQREGPAGNKVLWSVYIGISMEAVLLNKGIYMDFLLVNI